tara:strand:- start:4561 stop:5991 length:1431 start_codon:yes stop_codon:yes gene_type:complete
MSMDQERTFSEDLSETPNVLRYSDLLKVGSPLANMQYHTLIPSNGSVYGPDQQIRIALNVPSDSFVNFKGAYLKYTITNNNQATDDLALDGEAGVAAVIDQFRVVNSVGSVLEEISHYNACYALMNGMVSDNHRQSSMAITEGTSKTPLSSVSVGEAAGFTALPTDRILIAKGGKFTGCHYPMSGFMGGSDRLCPLGFQNGVASIELTLASLNTPFMVKAGATSTSFDWSVSNVELHVPVLTMGPEFNASFRQVLSAGIPINWASTSYHNTQSSAGSLAGDTVITTASRKRSVKSIFSIFRKSADVTNIKVDSVSCRRSLNCSQYFYTIGGQRMPSKPIAISGAGKHDTIASAKTRDIGEVYSNLVMSLSNLGNVYSATCFSGDNFFLADNNTDGTGSKNICSRVAYALDLESYPHSNVQSGMSLANQGLPIVLELKTESDATNAGVSNAILMDQFLLYDVIYSLNGVDGTIVANA